MTFLSPSQQEFRSNAPGTAGTSPAIAKAKLLSTTLLTASRLGIDPTAMALLAVLIAESWPSGDGWKADIARSTLAKRLSVSTRTIDAARERLKRAQLITHNSGDPRRASSFGICEQCSPLHPRGEAHCTPEVKPTAPQRCSPLHPRGEAHFTPEVKPTSPSSVLQQSTAAAAQTPPPPAAAAAEITIIEKTPRRETLTPDAIARRAEFLQSRPDWLPWETPWIDSFTAKELAADPKLTRAIVTEVMDAARAARRSLKNPAGWVVIKLRRIIGTARARPSAAREEGTSTTHQAQNKPRLIHTDTTVHGSDVTQLSISRLV